MSAAEAGAQEYFNLSVFVGLPVTRRRLKYMPVGVCARPPGARHSQRWFEFMRSKLCSLKHRCPYLNVLECKMALLTGSLPADLRHHQSINRAIQSSVQSQTSNFSHSSESYKSPVGITWWVPRAMARRPSAHRFILFILFCKNRSASCPPLLEVKVDCSAPLCKFSSD